MGQLHGNLTFKPSIKIDAASIYGSPVRTLLWQDKIRITLPKGFSEIEISLIYLDYLDFKKRRANMLVLIKKLIKDMFVGISEAISEKRFCF